MCAFPVSGMFEPRTANVTTVKVAWADALDAAINGVYGATRTILGLHFDTTGNTAKAAPASPTIESYGAVDLALKAAVGQKFTFNRAVDITGILTTAGGILEASAGITATTKFTTANPNLNHGSGSATVRDIAGSGGKAILYEIFGSSQTTDAATTLIPITFSMPSNKAVHITTTIIAIDSAFGASLMKMEADAFRRTGGLTNNVAAKDLYVATDEIGVTSYGWAINGANLEYQVAGKLATTIDWMVRAEIAVIG